MCAVLLFSNFFASPLFAFHPPRNVAPDGPGALAYFNLARKDCIGTARNTISKIWFTLADGALSDVYYPTLDNSNVKTLQYIVTDGKTFTDLQTRDTTYTVQLLDQRALACRVITTAKNHKYQITTDYITDPARNTLVAKVQFIPLVGKISDYEFYLYFDATINGNGGGGASNGGADNGSTEISANQKFPVVCDTTTKSNAPNRTYAQPVCSALATSQPFLASTNGFVGKPSDGLQQLDSKRALTAMYTNAYNGNVSQTAQVNLASDGNFVFALGFGKNAAEAMAAARESLTIPFAQLRAQYEADWKNYDAKLFAPPQHFENVATEKWQALIDEYYLSANVVKASEDKTFPGAIVASMAMPWGQAVSAGDAENLFVGSYRQVFARDAYHAWTALYLAGDYDTARDVVRFLFEQQQLSDGSFPRNSLLNGKRAPDSLGVQLDQVSYPILMAYQMRMYDAALYEKHIEPAANFIAQHGPAFGFERWEEQAGYSPSTIAAEIVGLRAAAEIAELNDDAVNAQRWRGLTDAWQHSIKRWTVTTNGPLASHPYFIRLSKTGDPNAALTYNLVNGGATLDQRAVIDAGFMELVRLGILPANDVDMLASLAVVDATIKRDTSRGAGWERYNGDGYGDNSVSGAPWTPTHGGNGHVWAVIAAERGEYELARGNRAHALAILDTLQQMSFGVGLLSEQNWEMNRVARSPLGTDPLIASIGFENGYAAGSATPLTWSAAAYVRLFRNLIAGELLEQPKLNQTPCMWQEPASKKIGLHCQRPK